jgi:hypothetical protein
MLRDALTYRRLPSLLQRLRRVRGPFAGLRLSARSFAGLRPGSGFGFARNENLDDLRRSGGCGLPRLRFAPQGHDMGSTAFQCRVWVLHKIASRRDATGRLRPCYEDNQVNGEVRGVGNYLLMLREGARALGRTAKPQTLPRNISYLWHGVCRHCLGGFPRLGGGRVGEGWQTVPLLEALRGSRGSTCHPRMRDRWVRTAHYDVCENKGEARGRPI